VCCLKGTEAGIVKGLTNKIECVLAHSDPHPKQSWRVEEDEEEEMKMASAAWIVEDATKPWPGLGE
jgi:hypothetical protein